MPNFTPKPNKRVLAGFAVVAFAASAFGLYGRHSAMSILTVGTLGLLCNSKLHDFGQFGKDMMIGQMAGAAAQLAFTSLRP